MRLAALILLLCVAGCSTPPPPELPTLRAEAERGPFRFEIALQPEQPRVGDPVTITLTATALATHRVTFPEDSAFAPFEVLARTTSEVAGEDPALRVEQLVLTAESYLSGSLEIAPLVLGYGTLADDGTFELENELTLDSLAVEVRSVLTSQDTVASPRDITGARLPAPQPWTWQQWTIAITAAVVALAFAAWLGYRWWKQSQVVPPPPPAEQLARADLQALLGDEWLQPERLQAFHYRLSEIVRAYIERQFDVTAAEMTTEEFLRHLSATNTRSSLRMSEEDQLLAAHGDKLRNLLEQCDMIKYARFASTSAAARASWEQASSFVDQTAEQVQRLRAAAQEAA